MEDQFYKDLVGRYLKRQLQEKEMEVFFHLLEEGKLDKYLIESMDVELEEDKNDLVTPISYQFLKPAYKIAAALIVGLLTFSAYFYVNNVNEQETVSQTNEVAVVPGGNNAVLTLSNGKKIILNHVSNGTLEKNDGFSVEKKKDGVLVFNINAQDSALEESGLNTIETPKGGIYEVILSDGTHVWLNSDSSIEFPAQFANNERKVIVKGEAFFEVSHDKKRPFKVFSNKQEIEVLGTKFNVNAYADEQFTKTTLLEGSVKVNTTSTSKLLKPGYQMVFDNSSALAVSKVDIESVMAWKNGFFQFDRVDIQTLMRQISRWYNIEVEYKGALPKDEFVGKIKRSEEINKVLEVLKYGNVKFQLIGRKLIVG